MRSTRVLLFALAASLSSLSSSLTEASNVDAVYYPDQGKVVLPNLKVGNLVYFAILNQLPNSYDFRLDVTSLNNLSAPLTFTPAPASDVIGTFSPVDDPASSATLNADGTYTMTEGADPTNPDCPKGGTESGTWQYEPTTGVFSAVALIDHNGECGFSNPGGIVRIKKVGTDLYFVEMENGKPNELKLVRK